MSTKTMKIRFYGTAVRTTLTNDQIQTRLNWTWKTRPLCLFLTYALLIEKKTSVAVSSLCRSDHGRVGSVSSWAGNMEDTIDLQMTLSAT